MSDRQRPPQGAPPAAHPAARTLVAFVDAVEEGSARLVWRGVGEELVSYNVPAALLPEGAGEGSWIELTVRQIPPPADEDPSELRRRLGAQDDGGDLAL